MASGKVFLITAALLDDAVPGRWWMPPAHVLDAITPGESLVKVLALVSDKDGGGDLWSASPVWLAVDERKGEVLRGRIMSSPLKLKGYRRGDRMTATVGDVIDLVWAAAAGAPPLNAERVRFAIGRRALIVVNVVTPTGELAAQRQLVGTIAAVDPVRGIEFVLGDGSLYRLPPDSRALEEAAPGEYELQSTGEIVVNPDYLIRWTIMQPEDITTLTGSGYVTGDPELDGRSAEAEDRQARGRGDAQLPEWLRHLMVEEFESFGLPAPIRAPAVWAESGGRGFMCSDPAAAHGGNAATVRVMCLTAPTGAASRWLKFTDEAGDYVDPQTGAAGAGQVGPQPAAAPWFWPAEAIYPLDPRRPAQVAVGLPVSELRVDAAGARVILDRGDQAEPAIYIDMSAPQCYADGTWRALTPDHSSALVGATLVSLLAGSAGLDLTFSTGQKVRCLSDPEFEAWQLVARDVGLWISLPGGALAEFSFERSRYLAAAA